MVKSRIIGHRGAAGLELENTIPSFQKAVDSNARIVEFDVHTTLDNQLVVCHDDNLERVSGKAGRIKHLTLKELRGIPLKNGATVPTLQEVLDFARRHKLAVIIEAKAIEDHRGFCALLDRYQDLEMVVASFNHETLRLIHELRPNYRLYLAEGHQAIATLHKAKLMGVAGIDLQYMLINPLTYLLARVWHLEIMLYTVNNTFIGRLLMFLYPQIKICTNYPNRFLSQKQA